MHSATRAESAELPKLDTTVVLFGIGISVLVLYICTFAINLHHENDFYTEAWPSYRLLDHGHFLAFLRAGPAYVGSLLMRAPFALAASAFGAAPRTVYFVTALPCVVAPAMLAGFLAANRSEHPGEDRVDRSGRGLRPIDLFMIMPPAVVALIDGHPEDILGATLCVSAVLFAQRGWGKAAGFAVGVALINKPWAVVVVPLVFAVMPADRRLAGLITMVVTAGAVMIPVTAIRAASPGSAGGSLGSVSVGIFLVPQLLWWFGRNSWVAREAHVLLVVVIWFVTAVWWWARVRGRGRVPRLEEALLALALVFFLRAALDPWDNLYYFAPFMLTLTVYEEPPGFPRLTWLYVILLVIVVPAAGVLSGLGADGHAAVFTAFALITIAWLIRRLFLPDGATTRIAYPIASGSRS